MSAVAILERARALGVQIRRNGPDLVVRGPKEVRNQVIPLIRAHKPELLAVLGLPRPEADESGTDWLLVDAGHVFRLPFQIPKTRGELLHRYPSCLVLRLPDADQARDLAALVAHVAGRERFSQEDIDEALEHALRDPEAALACFRGLAGESRTRADG